MAAVRLTLAAAALALLSACAAQRIETMTYASMREARSAGAVDRTWVPSWLPEEAYELRAAYDTGGWRRWGILNFRIEDADTLRAQLAPEEIDLAGIRMDIPGRIEWWPVALRGTLDAERITSTGLRAYRLRTGNFIVAVNWSQGRAYYWAIS